MRWNKKFNRIQKSQQEGIRWLFVLLRKDRTSAPAALEGRMFCFAARRENGVPALAHRNGSACGFVHNWNNLCKTRGKLPDFAQILRKLGELSTGGGHFPGRACGGERQLGAPVKFGAGNRKRCKTCNFPCDQILRGFPGGFVGNLPKFVALLMHFTPLLLARLQRKFVNVI